MINSRMRVIEEYGGRELADPESAGVVAQLHWKGVWVVARRLAGWISPNSRNPADGELLRRIEVVGGELAAQVEREAQVVRDALQPVQRIRELVIVAVGARARRIGRNLGRRLQDEAAVRHRRLERRNRPAHE